MRALNIDQLKPGFSLAVSLVDEKGHVLLQRGVQLTEPYIRALREKGFTRLYVKDDTGVDVEPDDNLSPVVRWKAVRALEETFAKIAGEVGALKGKADEDIRSALDSDGVRALIGPGGPVEALSDMVGVILDDILDQATLAGLTSLKNAESGMFEHAIDVCVISIMLGKAVGLDSRHMRQLAAGALLHDIGMVFVPEGIAERGRIMQHTQLGFELLKRGEDTEILSPYVAYEHHEHQDGSGLPRGLRGSNTIARDRKAGTPVPTLIGEIAAIANAYDNYLTGTAQRRSLSPEEAVKVLSDRSGTWFNQELVKTFRRIVQVYPRGTQVRLIGEPYDNFIAVVKETSDTHVSRPRVILVMDGKKNRITPEEVDTSKLPDIRLRSIGL